MPYASALGAAGGCERAKNTDEERNGREECKRQWNVSHRACVALWNAAP